LQRQIDDSGWHGRRILVSDGPPPTASAAVWSVDATARQEGQKKTYWRALALGLEECRRAGSDRILILEDDVELCTNALPYMERARLPSMFAFVTWYDGHAVPRGAARGIYPANALRFICLQAVTWTAERGQRIALLRRRGTLVRAARRRPFDREDPRRPQLRRPRTKRRATLRCGFRLQPRRHPFGRPHREQLSG
jgi:hypothetical protein